MCAITGLLSKEPISKETFIKMNNSASHRGPDDEGYYFENHLALGHRRLSIIDLSKAGHQPLKKEHLQITYNGEVYNYKELRTELEGLGHSFESETDTEVILTAYKEWGSECVKRFNGMWGFAIYDSQNESLFCSRDRFGIKPFYYHKTENTFIFASEIKQILAHPSVSRKVNPNAVSKYLISSIVDDTEETFFDGILKLDPGHNMFINVRTLSARFEQYYSLDQENTHYGPRDLREVLEDSIRIRMRSDVPVGSCLSGGLDSSLIVSFASRMNTEGKFYTFTSVPYDGKFDESAYVKKLEKDLPIQAHYLTPQPQDFEDVLEDVIRTQEEPFVTPSIFMQYFVMREAHKKGLKVLLDGQGADEILLGYEKYFPSIILQLMKSNPLFASVKMFEFIKNNDNINTAFFAKNFIKAASPHLLSPQAKAMKKILRKEFTEDDTYERINALSRNIKDFRLADILKFNLPALLRYEDKNSMRFGIETRLPFLDYRIVDIALKWPIEDLFHKGLGKQPLRSEFTGVLPKYIAKRRSKFNFNAPHISLEKLNSCVTNNVLTRKPKFFTPRHLWRIVNLEKWLVEAINGV